ncbi:thiol:disulfide interchange protein DsbA/DsbL [Burkholderia lata]|uniref:Thiol:disulfide interchange protein n=1 Tax=Burkholderia lata (strain ATCC 17760 / DSM 23089 / LMG 22485 / NCIMB 9086 / R18194 / 383) TaxID=482957 RepID=A0A6P2SB05_BURL3|nr:thiol:disulfide interchange protein DsbA/DsbL [Burkholderia lata]VWC47166.1 Thiol:disulfide interchange protein DsbA [Burkholderia lata]
MKRVLGFLTLAIVLVATCQNGNSAQTSRTTIRTLYAPRSVSVPAGKVEVVEFFHFGCRYCRLLEPALAAWRAKQGDRIVFRRVPVAPAPQLLPYAKLYHALVALRREALIPAVFDAIHTRGNLLLTKEQQKMFVSAHGVDPQRLDDALDSTATKRALQADRQEWEAYDVRAVPMLVVQGKFVPEPGATPDETVRMLDEVIARKP